MCEKKILLMLVLKWYFLQQLSTQYDHHLFGLCEMDRGDRFKDKIGIISQGYTNYSPRTDTSSTIVAWSPDQNTSARNSHCGDLYHATLSLKTIDDIFLEITVCSSAYYSNLYSRDCCGNQTFISGWRNAGYPRNSIDDGSLENVMVIKDWTNYLSISWVNYK